MKALRPLTNITFEDFAKDLEIRHESSADSSKEASLISRFGFWKAAHILWWSKNVSE